MYIQITYHAGGTVHNLAPAYLSTAFGPVPPSLTGL